MVDLIANISDGFSIISPYERRMIIFLYVNFQQQYELLRMRICAKQNRIRAAGLSQQNSVAIGKHSIAHIVQKENRRIAANRSSFCSGYLFWSLPDTFSST